MLSKIIFVIVLTLITGAGGLGLGGLLAALFKRESKVTSSLLLSFTAGLMLAIVSLDMLPEAMEAHGNYWLPPIFLLLGFGITFLLNCWVDKSAHHEDDKNPHHCACGHHDLRTAGIVLAAAIALHNLPVGLAVGTTVAAHGISWVSTLAAITIGLHNIPEGMSIALPFLHDGSRARSAIGLAALCGTPTILGALVGLFIGNHTPLALVIAMSLAGGAMLYVAFFELLPTAYAQWKSKWTVLSTVVGFALGVLLILALGHNHTH